MVAPVVMLEKLPAAQARHPDGEDSAAVELHVHEHGERASGKKPRRCRQRLKGGTVRARMRRRR